MSMKKTTVGILTSIDVDGNGICDNAKVVCSYVDEDQNGIYDHCKSGQGEVLTNGKGMRHRQGYRAGRNK